MIRERDLLSDTVLSATNLLAEPVVYSDPCRNRWGAIKLKLVQSVYGLNVTSDTIPDLKGLYCDWRDAVELLPMRLTHKKVGFKNFDDTAVGIDKWLLERDHQRIGLKAAPLTDHVSCNTVAYEYLEQSWINKKSVKRGNDVYIDMLRAKFAPLFESRNHQVFFSAVVNSKRKAVRRTRLLYLTGTCDQAIVGDIVAAWGSFGAYWNHYVTKLRNRFGKAAYIRSWQSQNNGYPHFHCLIYFFNFEFTTVPWTEADGSISWRVHNRQKVIVNRRTGERDYCRDVIKDLWQWGHLDVKCCDNSKSALNDLLKYVLRDLEGGASDLTNTMVWYFQKKSFAVSRSFMELFGDAGASLEPSDADLINAVGVIQEGTQEDTLVSIDIFPILPRDLLPELHQLRLDNVDHPPDPPPDVSRFLDLFADLCAPASSYKRDDGVVVTVFKYADRVMC